MKARVLVVDDEEAIRLFLKSRLEQDGHDVDAASNVEEALALFKRSGNIAAIVTDLRMLGEDGFSLIDKVKQIDPRVKVIVMTGFGKKEDAVKAIQYGIANYFEKPFRIDELCTSVKACVAEFNQQKTQNESTEKLEARIHRLEGKEEDQFWFVSKSKAMEAVNESLTGLRRDAMRGNAVEPNVVVWGEEGSGNEGIARMIHAGSRRGKGPWISLNCAQFSGDKLEVELFGCEAGAYPGSNGAKVGLMELAKGGTLFLNRVEHLDLKAQGQLERVLRTKTFKRLGGSVDLTVDVRIVSSTSADLKSKSSAGKFRETLYSLLSQVSIQVPQLKDRKEDILAIATQFAKTSFANRGKSFQSFGPDAERALQDYAWPGNVWELFLVIDRTSILYQGSHPVSASDLGIGTSAGSSNGHAPVQVGGLHQVGQTPKLQVVGGTQMMENGDMSYTDLKKKWCDSFEREYLMQTLNKNSGNVSAAAREAKLDRSNFLRLLRRHGLRAQEYRKAA